MSRFAPRTCVMERPVRDVDCENVVSDATVEAAGAVALVDAILGREGSEDNTPKDLL